MQPPAGSKMNGGGSGAVPAGSAPVSDGLTSGMEPVQKDCWAIFNHPDAHAKETGVGMDQVTTHACSISTLAVSA